VNHAGQRFCETFHVISGVIRIQKGMSLCDIRTISIITRISLTKIGIFAILDLYKNIAIWKQK